jgi:ankyrin repeat protein
VSLVSVYFGTDAILIHNSSACAYAQSSLLTSRPSQRPSWLTQMDLTLDEPSVTDDLCFTPLHHVVIGLEQADLRQQLRLNSIYINTLDSIGRSPLHWASIMGNSAAVSVLLEHGASPTTKDKEQMTPLHDIFLAPSLTQKQCAQLLLDSGAEVNALDFWERTALRIAVSYQSISLDFLEMLIDKGADVNCRDMYQQSPLLKSIQGSREATQLLLSHGADTELPDIYGNTPVLEAIYRENPERLQLLLEHGANINRDFQLKPGRRARDGLVHLLDFVVWYGNVEIMRIIEESIVYPFQLSHPVDNLEQFQNFRLANGRKAGGEEQDAIARILSKIVVANAPGSYFSSRGVDSDDEKDDCNNEIFVDAQEHFPEGGCAV